MTLILALLTVFTAQPYPSFPTCPGGHPADGAALAELADIEVQTGVPENRRGILAAVWCVETAWAPVEPVRVGDGGNAIGPMQIHALHVPRCVAPDHDGSDPRPGLLWSARCWLTRIAQILPKARVYCRSERQAWDVAEAMLSDPREYAWRCDSRSLHVRLLEEWRLRLALEERFDRARVQLD